MIFAPELPAEKYCNLWSLEDVNISEDHSEPQNYLTIYNVCCWPVATSAVDGEQNLKCHSLLMLRSDYVKFEYENIGMRISEGFETLAVIQKMMMIIVITLQVLVHVLGDSDTPGDMFPRWGEI